MDVGEVLVKSRGIIGDILSRKFPYTSSRSTEELKAIKKRYLAWDIFLSTLQIIIFFLAPLGYAYVLQQIYAWFYRSNLAPGETFYPVPWLAFIVCGFFWGLITVLYAANALVRNLSPELEDYYSNKKGFDVYKGNIWGNRIFFLLSLVTLPFVASSYLITDVEGIKYKSVIELSERKYRYSDISKIVFYKKYINKDRTSGIYEQHDIYFKNAETMNVGDYFMDYERAFPFIKSIADRSQIPIDTVDIKPKK